MPLFAGNVYSCFETRQEKENIIFIEIHRLWKTFGYVNFWCRSPVMDYAVQVDSDHQYGANVTVHILFTLLQFAFVTCMFLFCYGHLFLSSTALFSRHLNFYPISLFCCPLWYVNCLFMYSTDPCVLREWWSVTFCAGKRYIARFCTDNVVIRKDVGPAQLPPCQPYSNGDRGSITCHSGDWIRLAAVVHTRTRRRAKCRLQCKCVWFGLEW